MELLSGIEEKEALKHIAKAVETAVLAFAKPKNTTRCPVNTGADKIRLAVEPPSGFYFA